MPLTSSAQSSRATPRPVPGAGDPSPRVDAADPDAHVDGACVRFTLLGGATPVRVAVSNKAMVEGLGAEPNEASLLQAYRQHYARLHAIASEMAPSTLDGGVLVTDAALAQHSGGASAAAARP